jgi:hypothetical protein
MTEKIITTKTELLAEIEEKWTDLKAVLDHLTETQLVELRDAQGWTVKDHVIHMTRWERSVVYFLQGKPRFQGLDVDEALYLHGTEDAINDAIFQKAHDLPLGNTFHQFRETHQQLLTLLKPLTDSDLHRHYRAFLPDEPGQGEGPEAIEVILGNTSGHYAEHQGWIAVLAKQGS